MTRTNPRAHGTTVLLAAAATLLLAGCGSSTPGPGGSPTTSAPTSVTPTASPTPSGSSGSPTPVVPSHPVTLPPTPGPSSSSPTPIVPSHPVTFPPTTTPTSPSTTTLTGTIIEGTRPSCHILQAGTRRFSLTGRHTQDLRIGDRVTVEGTVRPHFVTSCGGVTFVVTRSQVLS